ncbi:MAG TPA: capsule assembly Wzi family protein, partial [Acidobacteriaceae bacterium]|nr:capsule assembly Wzi family protein [Acidobacteriaceae bacterium]
PPSPVASLPSIPTEYPMLEQVHKDSFGSTYIPDDSWVYPEALRLYSMGYLDSAFISMRPWTRRSLLHMLEKSATDIKDGGNEEALDIYAKLTSYLSAEVPGAADTPSTAMTRGEVYGLETGYTRLMGITGLTLNDSYHLGQTIVNDYGRPNQSGFNDITGFSSVNEWNRFSLYVRGEYQHAPAAAGYNLGLATYLSQADEILPFAPPNEPQATIPYGPIATANPFRLQEAALSFHLLGHEFSGGKTDAWLGPAQGGSMAWSNNAENIYSFRINRIEPMHIPLFSRVFGPLRYDFFVGSLKGHTFPHDPWVHSEMFSLRPTNNFEFSFQRTVIWGGHCAACIIDTEGDGIDEPVTLHSFFRSFFSFQDTQTDPTSKGNAQDPGARYSDFSFSWRLPFLSHYVTLYTDSIAHDDVSPISAPRRAAYRPGVYISQFPGLRKMDFRVEAASTDTSTLRSIGGIFNYYEAVQRQGYTNKGFIMGDWVGREAKAGQAWLTYHLSGNEWVQLEYLYKKTPKDFIAYGTTQNQIKLDVVKRLRPDLELNAWWQYEHWIAPVYQTTHQNDNVVAFQFTFYPKLRTGGEHLNGK